MRRKSATAPFCGTTGENLGQLANEEPRMTHRPDVQDDERSERDREDARWRQARR